MVVSWFYFSQTFLLLISLKYKWSIYIYMYVCILSVNGLKTHVFLQLTFNSDAILSLPPFPHFHTLVLVLINGCFSNTDLEWWFQDLGRLYAFSVWVLEHSPIVIYFCCRLFSRC